jgi:hypothetical protein
MALIAEADIVPGLVVHLDTAVLRSSGRCLTNAETNNQFDRAVVGPHYFLILLFDSQTDKWLAVPLFSQRAPGSDLLNERFKIGHPDQWIGVNSYFSRWQHWLLDSEAIVNASASDNSPPGSRRTYASNHKQELGHIASWRNQNRAAMRVV